MMSSIDHDFSSSSTCAQLIKTLCRRISVVHGFVNVVGVQVREAGQFEAALAEAASPSLKGRDSGAGFRFSDQQPGQNKQQWPERSEELVMR